MMRMLTRFYFIFILLPLLLAGCNSCDALSSKETKAGSQPALKEEAPADIYLEGNIAYNKMLNTWKLQSHSNPEGNQYADYYGGFYLDDNGIMHILVTNDDINTREDIKRIIESEKFILHKCKYSYNYLMAVMDSIDDFLITYPNEPLADNIGLWKIKEKENIVVVYLISCNEKSVEEFKKKVSDSPAIQFRPPDNNPLNIETPTVDVKFVDSLH
ncbi:MAG: hypothetical protein LUH22_03550 [Bacteroides sp.]|nr:hypothetical protein [Bacteroides sp.]